MFRDERLHAFIVARTSRSRSRIRRISIHKRWLKASVCAVAVVFCSALYGMYSLSQRFVQVRLERENGLLRLQNEKQQRQLDALKNRVEAVEDASRRLSQISGIEHENGAPEMRGTGGPLLEMDSAAINSVERRASDLEEELRDYEDVIRERARIPSVWPVEGELTDGFGMRRNPFGDGSSEFHAGLDIAAEWGAPVVSAGSGTVTFAGTQSGYGQIVIVDHGGGLSTRYGHLSNIEVAEGAEIGRGEKLGNVGSTGRSTGPHLHYEVRHNESAVSPRHYLPDRSVTTTAASFQ